MTQALATQPGRREHKLERDTELQLIAVGRCTTGIVHDLNNLLTVIHGQAELLEMTEQLGMRAARMVRDMLTATSRARELTRSVVDFSRPVPLACEPTDVTRAIWGDLPLIRAAAPSAIKIVHMISVTCPRVTMKPVHLHQVLMNLCFNAIDAIAGKSGTLYIEAEPGPGPHDNDFERDGKEWLLLRVSDTGPGMDAETIERLYEPFFSTRENEGGTGIGLPMVREIVQHNGGDIRVESAPGSGTIFTVYLPAAASGAALAQAPASPNTRVLHILYVDDEPSVAQIQRSTLRRLGFRVTTITDAVEADEHFRLHADDIDLVITDACMPGMSGQELSQRVKKHRPSTPVLMITGSHTAARQGAASPDIEGVLIKPVTPEDLNRAIRELTQQIGAIA